MQPTNSESRPAGDVTARDMERVDLEAVGRDLLLADRPAMHLELARLASRTRSQFVLKAWPG